MNFDDYVYDSDVNDYVKRKQSKDNGMIEGRYIYDHYYWDEMDREYTIQGTWNFEKNYPDSPDLWVLESLEIIEQERNAPDICIDKNSDVWLHIERNGVDEQFVKKVDYYEQTG